jgi:N-methylhydantoinase A
VNLRVTGVGPIRRPSLRVAPAAATAPAGTGPASASGQRSVCFGDGYVATPIFWRADLPAGTRLDGPAIIEEYGATVPLHPGFTATVDRLGNLVVASQSGQSGG